MSDFITMKLREGFYCIEQDFVRSFLIVGDKEALLVDTGMGGGNLKQCVEAVTGLPVTVIFTHADGDHVGDAHMFEKRLMHPSEFDYYRNKNKNAAAMEPVWEGDILDLGSYVFEVILIPGHTPGSIALLERDKRFLIGGDSIQTGNIFMFGPGRNFRAFKASMRKLEDRLSEFDIIYSSHNEMVVGTDTIHSLYTGAERMLRGEVTGIPAERFDGKVKDYRTDGAAFYAD